VQVGIGQLEALQLGVDGSKLLSQKKCLLLLREGLVYSRGNLRANFGKEKLLCFANTCVTCWGRNEGDSVERRATRETEQGSVTCF
jgi:hypothetical protein